MVQALERTLNPHRKQRKKANPIAWPELPDPNRKPRLSVCMIVKNEERFLGQCLASVKDIADELIVIDTGSTDQTVEIAQERHGRTGKITIILQKKWFICSVLNSWKGEWITR